MKKLIILTMAILLVSCIFVSADYYPEPERTDTRGIYEIINYTNYVTGYPDSPGLMFPILLLVLWVIIFVASKANPTPIAFTTASGVVALLSIPLAVLKLVAPRYMYITIIFAAIGFAWLKLESRRGF
jgi:hypothetical protein